MPRKWPMSNEVGVGARTHPYPLWRADPPTCLCAKSRAPRGGWFAMNRLLAALAVLTFALVATGLYFWLRVPDAQAKAYTHMHCPECHMEMAYTKAFEGKNVRNAARMARPWSRPSANESKGKQFRRRPRLSLHRP